MNHHLHKSSWSALASRCGWGLLSCVLLVLAIQSAFEGPVSQSVNAAISAPPPQPQYQSKKIEDVEVGNYVLSRDETTGEFASKPVVQIIRRVSDHLRILKIESVATGEVQRIETTDEHPFWMPGTG